MTNGNAHKRLIESVGEFDVAHQVQVRVLQGIAIASPTSLRGNGAVKSFAMYVYRWKLSPDSVRKLFLEQQRQSDREWRDEFSVYDVEEVIEVLEHWKAFRHAIAVF